MKKRHTDNRYKTSDCIIPNMPNIINKSSKKFAKTDPHMKPRKSNACLAPTETCKNMLFFNFPLKILSQINLKKKNSF